MQKSLFLQRMNESLYQTADAGDTLSDSECRSFSLSDSGCWRHSIRERMQECLYQTADAEVSLSDSGCRRDYQTANAGVSLFQTADAIDTLKESGCRKHSIRQRMQKYLYQTADAGVSLSDSGCKKKILGASFSLLNNLFTLKYTELTCILYLELESIH